MGKSSKKSDTKVAAAPAVVPETKSGKKGKRQPEDDVEKLVSAKKQKIEEVAQKQKKETKVQKKKESSSDDSSSESEDEKPAAKVVVPAKKAPTKNGNLTTPAKKGKPAASSSSSDDDSSDEDEVPAKAAPVQKTKKESSSDDSSDESSEDEKPAAKKIQPAKNGTQAKKDSSDSDSSDDDSDVEEIPKAKVVPAVSAKKPSDSSSESDSDSSDDDKKPAAKALPKKPAASKPPASSDDDSSESSEDEKPVAVAKKNDDSSESDDDSSSDEDSAPANVTNGNKKSSTVAKKAKEDSSSSESDSSDDEDKMDVDEKKPVKKSKDSSDSDESDEESEEEPTKTPQKKTKDVEMANDAKSAKKAPTTPATPKEQGGSKTLFVGNLSFNVQQSDIVNFFKEAGEVVDVRLASDEDGRFKGFGHVEFATAEAAQSALEYNGSDLLNRAVRLDLARERGERGAYTPNNNSTQKAGTAFVRGFDKSQGEDEIRASLEEHFGSCGEITRISIPKDYETGAIKGFAYIDIVAVAARDASFAVGGPSWTVKLGRRDSTTASKSVANNDLPLFTDDLKTLISRFEKKGLSEREMVTLSGAHTLGQAQCFTFRGRIYNNASTNNIDAGFASTRRRGCPSLSSTENNQKLAALDLVTPNSFDNNYYKNLIQKKGLLSSDQVLFSGGSTDGIVTEYSKNPTTFKSDFAAAMIKMGDIQPLTGSDGVIRTICSALD